MRTWWRVMIKSINLMNTIMTQLQNDGNWWTKMEIDENGAFGSVRGSKVCFSPWLKYLHLYTCIYIYIQYVFIFVLNTDTCYVLRYIYIFIFIDKYTRFRAFL
jgi:hypothetical protein